MERQVEHFDVKVAPVPCIFSLSQPFLTDSVKILRYFRAAEYFRKVLLQRRMSSKLVRWYRGARDRRRFVKMKAAAIVLQVWL